MQGVSNVTLNRIPDEKRPVKLQKIVLGYPAFSTQSAFQFDMSLNYKLSGLIKEHWSGKPVLVRTDLDFISVTG